MEAVALAVALEAVEVVALDKLLFKYFHIYILIAFMSIFNASCENPSKEAKIKMVLTGSVHGQLDPCG